MPIRLTNRRLAGAAVQSTRPPRHSDDLHDFDTRRLRLAAYLLVPQHTERASTVFASTVQTWQDIKSSIHHGGFGNA